MKFVTGDKQLDKVLNGLLKKRKGMAKRAVSSGLSVIAKAIKQDAPVGKTKQLKKSVGYRFKRVSKDVVVAKVGLNVAKKPAGDKGKPKPGQQAPEAPLVTLGTGNRETKAGANRGRVRPNGFVKRAVRRAMGTARTKIRDSLRRQMQKQK